MRVALPVAPPTASSSATSCSSSSRAPRRAARGRRARGGARDRAGVLSALRAAGPFDEHGDPVDPPVWLWRAADDWSLTPDRPLNGG